MTVEEYFNHLKVITENAGADKTGVKIETEDGYCISISVTKKQKKVNYYEKPEIRDSYCRRWR